MNVFLLTCSLLVIFLPDIANLAYSVVSNYKGRAPCQMIPGLPLILYAFLCWQTRSTSLFFGDSFPAISKILDFCVLACFHVLMTYLIPIGHAAFLRRNQQRISEAEIRGKGNREGN
jgi:hypothetical protein